MWVLWIFAAVVGVLFIFCVCGVILSGKRSKHDKKLRKSSDYAFKTEKGNYSFLYLIKGFKTEEGKLIKFAVHPFVGFSDFAHANTNGCDIINIVCKDRKTGEEIKVCDEIDTTQRKMDINSKVLIPSKFLDESGIADLEVKIVSAWNLGGDTIFDELTFDFQK